MVLQLEHINGVHNDNRIEKLCFLCPNCHSQTSTYAGKKLKKEVHERKKRVYFSKDLEKEKWEIIINSGIDFQNDIEWLDKIAVLLKNHKGQALKYIKRHYPDFFKTCKAINPLIVENRQERSKEEKRQEQLKVLQNSGIDFSKFGWTIEVNKILQMSPAKVGNYVRKNFPELNCFTRGDKNSNEGKHWYNNGKEEVSAIECPKGFAAGRLKN